MIAFPTETINYLEMADAFTDLALTARARWYKAFDIASTARTREIRVNAFKACDRLNKLETRFLNSADMCFAEALVLE